MRKLGQAGWMRLFLDIQDSTDTIRCVLCHRLRFEYVEKCEREYFSLPPRAFDLVSSQPPPPQQ